MEEQIKKVEGAVKNTATKISDAMFTPIDGKKVKKDIEKTIKKTEETISSNAGSE